MNVCPKTIQDIPVIQWAFVEKSVRPTGNTTHSVNGRVIGPSAGLAICQNANEQGIYLLYCDKEWNVIADTWHQSIEGAKGQAEFEYDGISSLWRHSIETAKRIDAPS